MSDGLRQTSSKRTFPSSDEVKPCGSEGMADPVSSKNKEMLPRKPFEAYRSTRVKFLISNWLFSQSYDTVRRISDEPLFYNMRIFR